MGRRGLGACKALALFVATGAGLSCEAKRAVVVSPAAEAQARARVPIDPALYCAKKVASPDAPGCAQSRKPEEIQPVVRANYPSMRACYVAALTRDPMASGRVVIRFAISPAGEAGSVCLLNSGIEDDELVRCVQATYRSLRFEAGACRDTTVIYPILFEPGSGAQSPR